MQDRTNTIAGWVLFSGIMALGLSIVSGMYFHAGDPEVPENPGYAVEVAEDEGGESGPSLAELLATGSAASGEAVFAKCTACHTIEQGGANGIGPNLYGVMGQSIGKHVAGFAYSEALSSNGGTWTWENMDAWLKSPRGFANGTKMSFAGLSKPEDRANLMLYLETFGGAPSKPAYDPEAAAAETEEGEIDGAGEGPGPVEGAEVDPVEAAGAMGADQPVPSE